MLGLDLIIIPIRPFYYYLYGVFKNCGQPHSGHAGAEMEGCKQAKGRSGWAPDGSHPVDGWPCDNLTHQPPPPLLCTITQADKQASTAGESEARAAAHSAAVSPVRYGRQRVSPVPVYLYMYISTPLFAGPIFKIHWYSAEITVVLISWKSFFPPFSSGWMKYEFVTMAITIFGFCLHAVMRQAFPSSDITTISSLSWPCNPIMDILDAPFKCVLCTPATCTVWWPDLFVVETRGPLKLDSVIYFFSLPDAPSADWKHVNLLM